MPNRYPPNSVVTWCQILPPHSVVTWYQIVSPHSVVDWSIWREMKAHATYPLLGNARGQLSLTNRRLYIFAPSHLQITTAPQAPNLPSSSRSQLDRVCCCCLPAAWRPTARTLIKRHTMKLIVALLAVLALTRVTSVSAYQTDETWVSNQCSGTIVATTAYPWGPSGFQNRVIPYNTARKSVSIHELL